MSQKPIQKLFIENVKQDIAVKLSQQQIAVKYGVVQHTVSAFCTRHNLTPSWESSNSLGLPGELLFSKLFNYDINYNLTSTRSEFDFYSQALGNVDVKISNLCQYRQKDMGYKAGFRTKYLFEWNKHNNHKRVTPKNTADTYVCFGVSDIVNVCLVVPGFELEHRERIQLCVSLTHGLDTSKSHWLQYIDLDISNRIQAVLDTI